MLKGSYCVNLGALVFENDARSRRRANLFTILNLVAVVARVRPTCRTAVDPVGEPKLT
jgi:hypothetical protein